MTVLDASNLLYEWFQTNDSFESNRDLRKVVPIMEDEEVTHSAFKLALVELENNTMIASQDYGDKKYYILTKPYNAYQQNIELASWTSQWMAGEINEFCNLIEDNTDLCTASQVSDKDIRNLVHIIQFYKGKLGEKEEIISGLQGTNTSQLHADALDALLDIGKDDSSDKKDEDDDEGSDDDKNKKNKKKK